MCAAPSNAGRRHHRPTPSYRNGFATAGACNEFATELRRFRDDSAKRDPYASTRNLSDPQPDKQGLLMINLSNKVALVTGSTSGIGLGIARAFAGAGANVMLNGFGDKTLIDDLLAEFASRYKISAAYSAADMSRPAEIAAMVAQAARELGGVDILVNNAGIQHVAPVEDFPVEKWDAIIAINLSAAFHAIRAALPGMKARNWGRIVNIASTHGLVASAQKAAYVAAKHGILGLTKVVALETATSGITCNAICPGWVLTPLVQKQIDDRAAREEIGRRGADGTAAREAALAGVRHPRADRRGSAVPVLAGCGPDPWHCAAGRRRMDRAMKTILLKDAAALIPDGATVMIGGFMGVGTPERLIDELVRQGKRNLTVIANDNALPGIGIGKLISAGAVKKTIASHIGLNPETQKKMLAGELEVDLVPQGTLIERIRAGGFGLGGVLTPTGVGTVVEKGKQRIEVGGKPYLLETALRADFALVDAFLADYIGNLYYALTARNFNPVMAMAADTVIVEAENIVPVGVISPDNVVTPAPVVDYIISHA